MFYAIELFSVKEEFWIIITL